MTNTSPVTTDIQQSLDTMLRELFDGPAKEAAFVLNPGDRGLLASLDRLTAAAASARPDGRASIAAHLDHLCYGFALLNRSVRGEDPWASADYAASWQRQRVTDDEWRALRKRLADEASAWRAACRDQKSWDLVGLTTALASAVHLAYHFGAIRQIDRSISGPPSA